MYEQVGNSVAYQLLLQSNPCITEKLINSMYPALKVSLFTAGMFTLNMTLQKLKQELQASTEWLFKDYLEAFNAAIKRRATPQCLHPADDPTINFLLDLCVQVSSLPVSHSPLQVISGYLAGLLSPTIASLQREPKESFQLTQQCGCRC